MAVQPATGLGLPQAACLLHPKAPDPHRWAKVAAPSTVKLEVLVEIDHRKSVEAAVDSQMHAETSVEWSFVPQFIALDDKRFRLATGETCGVLSLAYQKTAFLVWTGGHPVEATLAQQLSKARRGALAVHISEPSDAPANSPAVSVTVVWDAAVPFSGFEEVELRLESRSSGQVLTLKVRIDGSPVAEASSLMATRSTDFFGVPQLLFLCVLISMGCLLCYACGGFGPLGRVPSARLPAARAAAAGASVAPGGLWAGYGVQAPAAFEPAPQYHAQFATGQGSTPFRRVDLRPY